MDLGSSLAYWVQADDPPELEAIRMLPTHLPGMMTRRELVAPILGEIGPRHRRLPLLLRVRPVPPCRHRAADLLPLREGQTTNKRFAQFGPFVTVLCHHAERVIQSKAF